jgi:hypothetical protein
MKTVAAILWEPHTDWSVDEIELDPPKQAEVFGATHTVASVEDALAMVTDLTWGQMAEKATMGEGAR